MLQTPLCDLLGIDMPVILVPFGPWEEVELAATVCEAGSLGSLGTAAEDVPRIAERPSMAEIVRRAQARAKATGSTVTSLRHPSQ